MHVCWSDRHGSPEPAQLGAPWSQAQQRGGRGQHPVRALLVDCLDGAGLLGCWSRLFAWFTRQLFDVFLPDTCPNSASYCFYCPSYSRLNLEHTAILPSYFVSSPPTLHRSSSPSPLAWRQINWFWVRGSDQRSSEWATRQHPSGAHGEPLQTRRLVARLPRVSTPDTSKCINTLTLLINNAHVPRWQVFMAAPIFVILSLYARTYTQVVLARESIHLPRASLSHQLRVPGPASPLLWKVHRCVCLLLECAQGVASYFPASYSRTDTSGPLPTRCSNYNNGVHLYAHRCLQWAAQAASSPDVLAEFCR